MKIWKFRTFGAPSLLVQARPARTRCLPGEDPVQYYPLSKRTTMTPSFSSFWPEYVRAHRRVATRVVHTIGTLAGWMILGAALMLHRWWWIAAAVAVPYALAWISHFFIEHNRPATFGHPLWSWWADQRMVALTLAGKMG